MRVTRPFAVAMVWCLVRHPAHARRADEEHAVADRRRHGPAQRGSQHRLSVRPRQGLVFMGTFTPAPGSPEAQRGAHLAGPAIPVRCASPTGTACRRSTTTIRMRPLAAWRSVRAPARWIHRHRRELAQRFFVGTARTPGVPHGQGGNDADQPPPFADRAVPRQPPAALKVIADSRHCRRASPPSTFYGNNAFLSRQRWDQARRPLPDPCPSPGRPPRLGGRVQGDAHLPVRRPPPAHRAQADRVPSVRPGGQRRRPDQLRARSSGRTIASVLMGTITLAAVDPAQRRAPEIAHLQSDLSYRWISCPTIHSSPCAPPCTPCPYAQALSDRGRSRRDRRVRYSRRRTWRRPLPERRHHMTVPPPRAGALSRPLATARLPPRREPPVLDQNDLPEATRRECW